MRKLGVHESLGTEVVLYDSRRSMFNRLCFIHESYVKEKEEERVSV